MFEEIYTRFGIDVAPALEGTMLPETIGELTVALLNAYPDMRESDILTFVSIDANIAGEDFIEDLDAQGMQTSEPSWFIRQIVLDSTDSTRLASVGLFCGFNADEENPVYFVAPNDSVAVPAGNAGAGVVVLSRNTNSGLKVANAVLSLNEAAYNVYNAMRSNSYLQKVLAWWGAQQQAILQGSVAENKQQKVSAKVTLIGGQRPVAELSYSAGQAKSVGITFDSDPVGVTADNFIVEGAGVTKTYSNSILTLTFANPGEYSIKFGSQKIAIASVEGERSITPGSFTDTNRETGPMEAVGFSLEGNFADDDKAEINIKHRNLPTGTDCTAYKTSNGTMTIVSPVEWIGWLLEKVDNKLYLLSEEAEIDAGTYDVNITHFRFKGVDIF